MISTLRTALTMLVLAVLTLVLGAIVIIAAALGVKHREGGVLDRLPRVWARGILWAAGVKVRIHGWEHVRDVQGRECGPFIFAGNHVSHFDILALVGNLPPHYFVAKSELFKIPVFGAAIRAVGTIPIERANQKAAFGAYHVAAGRIKHGASVVVFPEGTRGTSYAIREFKKGPFVLAIQAGVPIVPCIVHGTIEVLPKKSLRVHPNRVDVHLLEPVPTAGRTYGDRDEIATVVRERMSIAMNTLYLNA